MKEQGGGSGKKIANNLVALSSAAILSVDAAGYLLTKAAADRFTVAAAQRRPASAPVSRGASIGARPRTDETRSIGQAPSAAEGTRATPAAPPVARDSSAASTRTSPSPQTSATSVQAPGEPQSPAQAADAAAQPFVALPNDLPVAVAEPVQPTADVAALQPAAPEALYKDGTFVGWGYCRHGAIEATVVIESGKLVTAGISLCDTRYPCSMISKLPPQVVSRQTADVDYVSGATDSADAFHQAVADALTQAGTKK